jgi:branched-chain amino acid transport system ATP-binding protein
MSVRRGSITGLIGPNGAGKTTLFNIVAGVLRPDFGEICFDGEDVTGTEAHELFARGLLRTFQIAHEFGQLTAIENLMVVPRDQAGESLFTALVNPRRVLANERRVRRKAEEVLEFIGLGGVAEVPASHLSGGQKKLLELGRTMMADAKIVLLDEVGAGVNRTLLGRLVDNIRRMNKELGYTFFIIEHDMDLIASLCDPVIVMANGAVIAQGPIAELRANPMIVEAYFGPSAEVAV